MKVFSKARGEGREARGVRAPRLAFTLIEMMIVIGLIAMVMAIGIPAFVHAHQKAPLKQAVNDVLEVCAHARAQAILRGAMVELVIRPADGSFNVAAGATADPTVSGRSAPAGTASSAQMPAGVRIALVGVNFEERQDWEEVRVRFHPNGTSDAFTVALQAGDGEAQAVTVDMVTGYANVEQPK